MKHLILFITFLSSLNLLVINQAEATPHCLPCPYSCADLGLGKKDCSQASNAGGICCLDLTQKGLDLAYARERVVGSAPAPVVQAQPVCPSGFSPRAQKCSPDERRRGCRDLRGSTGQTCVGW